LKLFIYTFSWEKEKLFDSWFADDPSKIALKAGVILDNIDEESHGPVCDYNKLIL
jgi:hypothetical protein